MVMPFGLLDDTTSQTFFIQVKHHGLTGCDGPLWLIKRDMTLALYDGLDAAGGILLSITGFGCALKGDLRGQARDPVQVNGIQPLTI